MIDSKTAALWNTTPPTDRPLTAGDLEQIAFNLCSLHDFDPSFVASQERFAKAVITEYERARPATSAASEVEGAVNHLTARLTKPGAFRIDDEAHLRTVLAALASPPSERERELEALVADFLTFARSGSHFAYPLGSLQRLEALTAQPAGEPTHG